MTVAMEQEVVPHVEALPYRVMAIPAEGPAPRKVTSRKSGGGIVWPEPLLPQTATGVTAKLTGIVFVAPSDPLRITE